MTSHTSSETHGGYAVAVHGGGGFAPGVKQTPAQRVENAAPPDYSRGGELMRTREHAVRACASRAAMRALAAG